MGWHGTQSPPNFGPAYLKNSFPLVFSVDLIMTWARARRIISVQRPKHRIHSRLTNTFETPASRRWALVDLGNDFVVTKIVFNRKLPGCSRRLRDVEDCGALKPELLLESISVSHEHTSRAAEQTCTGPIHIIGYDGGFETG